MARPDHGLPEGVCPGAGPSWVPSPWGLEQEWVPLSGSLPFSLGVPNKPGDLDGGGRRESLQAERVLGVTEAQVPNNSPPSQSGPVSWAPQRGEPRPRHQPGQPGPAMPAAGPELAAPHQRGQQEQREDLKEEHRGGAGRPGLPQGLSQSPRPWEPLTPMHARAACWGLARR